MQTFATLSIRFSAVLILLFAVLGTPAQNNRSSISGFVFGEDRRPVPEIYVELLDEVNGTIGRVRTDGSGRFFFGSLSQGRFTLKVLPGMTNFQEQSVDVEIYGYGARGRQLADNVQRDIYLKLRKGANAVPFVNEIIFAQDVPRDAEAAFEKALDHLKAEKGDEGVAELRKALQIFPDYFAALQKLGIIYIGRQQYEEARDTFDHAVKVNSSSFDCLYGLAYAEYALGNFDAAIESGKRSISLKPDSLEVNLLLGVAYRQAKRYEESEAAFLKAQSIADGASPDVHYQLALLYAYDLKQYGNAAKQLELFLKAAPDARDKDAIKKLIKQYKDKEKEKKD